MTGMPPKQGPTGLRLQQEPNQVAVDTTERHTGGPAETWGSARDEHDALLTYSEASALCSDALFRLTLAFFASLESIIELAAVISLLTIN